MHIKKYIITVAASLCWLASVQAQPKADKIAFINAFNTALETKDTTGLSIYLAPEFAVAGHTEGGAAFRLHQIIKNAATAPMQIAGHKKVSKGLLYQLELTDKSGKKSRAQALVNEEGKLLYLTHFDALYGLHRESKSRLIAQVPFENWDGSIILQVKINGFERPLRLLFDTGADGMAVSRELADSIGLKVTRENKASVVGGNQTIQVSDGNTVLLDTLILENMGIAIFPDMQKEHADGIIGNTLIRRYITHIDYENNILSLYSFGEHKYRGKGKAVSATMPSGVLLIPGELEIVQGKKYSGRFVFDTGASYDLICFRPFVRQNKLLVSGFKPEQQATTVSMGVASPTFIGPAYQFALAPLPAIKNMPVTLMGGTANNEQWDPGADGSVGVHLLKRYNITINIAEGEAFFSLRE